jgi:hypothetical protein
VSRRDGQRGVTDFGKTEAKYFSREDWTTRISLMRLTKFVFARRRFRGLDPRQRRVIAIGVHRSCPTGESIGGDRVRAIGATQAIDRFSVSRTT